MAWAASRALLKGWSLGAKALYLTMIMSTTPASAAVVTIWARSLLWHEKPTNFALPDLRIASAVSLNSLPLRNSRQMSAVVVVAQAVEEEGIDRVELEGFQPLVELLDHLLGRSWACPW